MSLKPIALTGRSTAKAGKVKSSMGYFTALGCIGGFIFFSLAGPLGADESVSLKYTYRPDTAQVSVLHDIAGKAYLPLNDVAQFYGIQMTFDSQSRRITLSKGRSQVKLVLSQPIFLTVDPEASYPIEPAEVVAGQVGVTPESAEDIFGAILNISVRYQADQQSLVAGAIKFDDIKQEIQEAGRVKKEPLPGPTAPSTLAGVVLTPTPQVVSEEEAEEEPLVKTVERAPDNQNYQVRRIVIDPGHGGKDSGAMGFTHKYYEKQATLDISKRVVEFLKADGNLEVFMTRSTDKYISLKYRTDFANRHSADLFVSIHCNSNPRSLVTGTETYYYGNKPSNRLAAVAAVSEGTIDDALGILADITHRFYDKRSYALATEVDARIRDRLKQHIRHIHHGPFYVLRQVDMPSILVETAYISNQTEEIKLRNPKWRDQIAKAIADGILAYRDQMNRVVNYHKVIRKSHENREVRR